MDHAKEKLLGETEVLVFVFALYRIVVETLDESKFCGCSANTMIREDSFRFQIILIGIQLGKDVYQGSGKFPILHVVSSLIP